MSDYIAREEAKTALGVEAEISTAAETALEDAIDGIPAADVAPVVRCENCTSGIMSDDNKYIICCRLGVGMELDDFCSYGAWKNNGSCSEWRKVVDATD